MTDHEQTLAGLSQQARTDAGLTQQQLADETKIPLSFIRAIEGGEQDFLPDPTYCRGFIRLLCKILRVDSAPFLDAYQRTLQERQSTSRSQRDTLYSPEVLKARPLSFNSANKGGNRLWLLMLFVVLSIGVFFVTKQDDPSSYSPAVKDSDQPMTETSPSPVATDPPATDASQTLTLVVEQPVQVMTAFDGKQEHRELLLPQTYVFKFNKEGQIVVEDTNVVRLWFNDEEIVKLRKGGKRRRLVFRANEPTERSL